MNPRTPAPAVTVTGLSLALALTLTLGLIGSDRAGARETDAERTSLNPPKVEARSWALVDAETGIYLAGKNPEERVPIASTTNVMVALLALERGVDLDEEVTVSDQAERFVGFTYSNVGLISGERLSVRELLTASLVPSGTDAVYALAEHLGGGGGKAGVGVTVERMNEKAKEMGLKNTHFENPAGLDARGHYSSARDLATIAREAMRYEVFREIVSKETATVTTQSRPIQVFTTNQLLQSYPYATGVKTGFSVESGPSLVASAEKGDEAYISVVLGAEGDVYPLDASRTTLEFGFARFDHKPLVSRGKAYEELVPPYRQGESVELDAAEDVPGISGPGLKVERKVSVGKPPASVKADEKHGTIEVFVDGESVGSSPLIAAKGYEEASVWQKARNATVWPAQRVWPGIRSWISSRVT